MEQSLIWINALLGIVAFLLVEVIKFIKKQQGEDFKGTTTLWITLAVSLVLASVAGIVTGEIDLGAFIDGLRILPEDPVAAINAVFVLVQEFVALVGVVLTAATTVYAILKGKLKDAGLLSWAVELQ